MARRYKAPVEKPKDFRLPHDFIEGVLLGTIMNNGSRALAEAVEPPPSLMTEHEGWDGKKLDALFGMSHRRRIASQMWQGYELAKAEAGANTPETDELGEADAYVGGPRVRVVNLRMPQLHEGLQANAVVVQTTFRTFYPAMSANSTLGYSYNGYRSRIGSLRHADYRELTPDERAMVEDMRTWGIDTMKQRDLASDAASFVNALISCASAMSQIYAMIPDFAQTLGALGVSGDYIRASGENLRGVAPFDRARFYRDEPRWALDWAKHRTTMLSMALAAKHNARVPDGTVAVWHHCSYSTDNPDLKDA